MESLKDEEAKIQKDGKLERQRAEKTTMSKKSKRLNEKKERRNVGKRIVGKTGNRTKH